MTNRRTAAGATTPNGPLRSFIQVEPHGRRVRITIVEPNQAAVADLSPKDARRVSERLRQVADAMERNAGQS